MELRKTDDGSDTIWSEKYRETYHSTFGAVTESNHVFIKAGLDQSHISPLNIFEMGFGTGLNGLLTFQQAKKANRTIVYHAIELNPVPVEIALQLSVKPELQDIFQKFHASEWNKEQNISSEFMLTKILQDFLSWQPKIKYNLVFFDAFSPETQPELWSQEVFLKIFKMLHSGGLLTTYCAKGLVRRNMMAAGFKVERLPGPPGKREMLRAIKA